jgi:hypothetical protein
MVAGLPHSAVAAKTLLARVYSEAYGDVEQETANASFIAAANPAAISELLDRLEAAEKERDALRKRLADGSVLCGCVPQGDGDYWWEGPSGEVFIDPRYAPVTHWRLAAAPGAKS